MALRDVALVLGPVVFAGFEIPQTIAFGGDQRLAVHDMPGGQRVIDALGPKPTDITWSGVFGGQDATLRARLLDTLRAQGQSLPLSWDVFFYTVIIRSFAAAYHNTAWVPYRLSLTVVQDDALAAAQTIGDLVADALGDASSAGDFAALAGVGLAALQTAVAAPNATVLGTAGYLAANTALAGAQASVQAGLDGADASLAGYAQSGLGSAGDVTGMIGAAGDAAALSSANAYLDRLDTNLGNAGS